MKDWTKLKTNERLGAGCVIVYSLFLFFITPYLNIGQLVLVWFVVPLIVGTTVVGLFDYLTVRTTLKKGK